MARRARAPLRGAAAQVPRPLGISLVVIHQATIYVEKASVQLAVLLVQLLLFLSIQVEIQDTRVVRLELVLGRAML